MEAKEAISLGLTVARLGQAYQLVSRIKNNRPTSGVMAGILITDLADGVLARYWRVDNSRRRIADAAVDRISMGMAALAAYKSNETARPYITAITAKEAFVTAGNVAHYVKEREVIKGNKLHRLSSLSIAACAISLSHGDDQAIHITGRTATAINYALATDYYAAWRGYTSSDGQDSAVRETPGLQAISGLLERTFAK